MTAPQAERPLILPPLPGRTMHDARSFAYVAHRGQIDKARRPYVTHLARVHERLIDMLDGLSHEIWDDLIQIAYLHDVINDTPYTADDLLNEGFRRNVVDGVKLLSKPPGCRRYLGWIGHIVEIGTLPTILVKIADIEDNSDPERLALLDEPTRERLKKKYGAALPILKEAAARLTAKDEGETR
jgi:hypothetical protein